MRPLVVSGSAHPSLAAEIAREVECELAPCLVQRFPDGEQELEIQASVRGQVLFIVQPLGASVGENLLWASPNVSAGHAMTMWIASPEHLQNLLTPRWRQIGISAVHVVRAPGVFHGLRVTIITTDFGARTR